MKKLFVILVMPLLAFTVVPDWKIVKLDEHISINFPGDPVVNETSGNKVWTTEIDSANRCLALILDFQDLGMDSAQIAAEFTNPEAFEIFKNGIIGKMEGASIISENNTTSGGHLTFEFVIDMGKDTGEINYMYTKNIFIGTKMYSMSFYQATQEKNEANDKFFDSLVIN